MNKLDNVSELSLAQLKAKSPSDLLDLAEELEVENASTMRKGDMMFAILKEMAEEGEISGDGVLEVLQDGFGFCEAQMLITYLGQTIYMLARAKLKNFLCEQGIQLRVLLERPKRRTIFWISKGVKY